MSNSYPEDCIFEVNGRALDYPAAETYRTLTPEIIKALCELDLASNTMFRSMPSWETQSPLLRLFYRLKAYWMLRDATDAGAAASFHLNLTSDIPPRDPFWEAKCQAQGWGSGRPWPTCLRDIEEAFLTPAMPSAHLIIDRCPQLAMIYVLRGDVSEPYWWAILSITERATPNLSRECSDGFPGFSDEELAYRVGRIRDEDIKPALCERLDGVNRGVCNLCRFKGIIRSPIALGYEHEPKQKKVVSL